MSTTPGEPHASLHYLGYDVGLEFVSFDLHGVAQREAVGEERDTAEDGCCRPGWAGPQAARTAAW